MKQQMSLQDLVWQNGPLTAMLATGYINEIAGALERLHNERHICHLDVRPDMILLDANGKVTLKESTVSQSYSEQWAEIDFRDLKAVHHYLLTGKKKEESVQDRNPDDANLPPQKRNTNGTLIVSLFLLAAVGLGLFFYVKNQQKPEMVSCDYQDFHYEGEWVNGKPDGKGTAKYNDGRWYEGRFEKGLRFDSNACFIYADGNVFVGTFAGDTIKSGKVTLKSGEYYFIGDFSDGKPFTGSWFRTSDNKEVEIVKKGKETVL